MWVVGLVHVLFITSLVHLAYPKSYPSFSNGPRRTLTTFAVAASSVGASPPARFSNIADYRKKEEKAQELQSEKQLIEDDEITEDPAEQDRNEANPSFIQKTINKILSKIQLASSFITPSETDNSNATNVSAEEVPKTEVKIDLQQPDLFKSRTSPQNLVSKHYGDPLKMNLEIQEWENVTESETVDKRNGTENQKNKFGPAGIYFAELFGGFLALIYGAVAHINRVINGGNLETRI